MILDWKVFSTHNWERSSWFTIAYLKFNKKRIARLINADDKEQTHLENLDIGYLHLTRLWVTTRFVLFAASISVDRELFLIQVNIGAVL